LALGQRLLRHSDPRLTANVYTHLDDRDTQAALAAIQAQVESGRARSSETTLRSTASFVEGREEGPGAARFACNSGALDGRGDWI
jgi:hypothetical protein